MKITHLCKGDSASAGGGGAGSMYRLHCNLKKHGIDSNILCEQKDSYSDSIAIIDKLNALESCFKKVTSNLGFNDLHRISSFKLHKHELVQDADAINIHGLHRGFFNFLALPRLTHLKPTIFTLRDMWAFTGHCVFSFDCQRWVNGCGKCPYPQESQPIKRDATRIEWLLKKWAFKRSNLVLVCLSKAFIEYVKKSFLKDFPVIYIPNGVNTQTFRALSQKECRLKLGLPEKNYIILVAANCLNSNRKGKDLIIKTMANLSPDLKKKTTLLLFGGKPNSLCQDSELQTVHLGYLYDEESKAIAYSAADLFFFPSRAESFGQMALESIACETPVVALNTGPVPELVRPNETGLLADDEKIENIVVLIEELLTNRTKRNNMKKRCREIALNEYSDELETKRYINLYKTVQDFFYAKQSLSSITKTPGWSAISKPADPGVK